MNRNTAARTCAQIFVVLAVTLMLAGMAAAQVNGALFTTDSNGNSVDQNIYAAKDDVYITGGPQNNNDPGLSPDGPYYFMVTDPSGATLLSHDTNDVTTNRGIECREVQVTGGRIVGVLGTCVHVLGTFNSANGEQPVQLIPYDNTPNPGGEYKAWITPVARYSPDPNNPNCSSKSNITFGFCDSDSKTDNFKVKPPPANVSVCKFDDVNGTGVYDPSVDTLIAGWPINATGVDGGPLTKNTGPDGCVTFRVTNFTNPDGTRTVTFTEGSEPNFTQTAPPNGTCTLSGTFDPADTCSVSGATPSSGSPASGGVITANISPNDAVTVPYFGNTLGAGQVTLFVAKTAAGGNKFNWTIAKSATKTQIDTTNGTATFTYTVSVTHDAGTGWKVQGTIGVTNPSGSDIDNVTVSDQTNVGGTCNVANAQGVTIPANTTVSFNYTCTFDTNPGSGTNTASATWDSGSASGTADFDFTSADTSVTVTDSLAGNLGTVAIQSDNSTTCTIAASGFNGDTGSLGCAPGATTTFTYTMTFSGDKAGTCTTHTNTASFTDNLGGTGSSTAVNVVQCVGEDLTLSKTATATFTSGISKSVDKTKVEQSGGNVTFNYTVSLTSPSFSVTGTITVTNPNDWESITANITDTIDNGGTCAVTGGNALTVAAGATVKLPYTCSYTGNPTAVSGTNTASASETGTLDTGVGDPNNGQPGIVPGKPANGTATYSFNSLTITDNVQSSAYPSGCNASLGTVTVTTTTASTSPGCGVTGLNSPSWGVFKYSITDTNSSPGTCTSYNNTAQITGGSSSNQVTVTVCNTNTGALTMGFWKNTNGQKIITNSCMPSGGTSLMTYLSGFNPFKDDTKTTCKDEASYVYSIINGATCSSGGYCNTMLRAQMLATALDVYFSTPGLGGNLIGAYSGLKGNQPALGGVAVDLSHICNMLDGSSGSTCTGTYEDSRPEFGIAAPCLGTTVSQMLGYANASSTVNGSPVATANTGATWYNQLKSRQVYAKDGFDNFNNQIANIAPTACSPTF